MTDKPTPTDAEILDAAEDFRSQYTHGGTTFDEFDEIGFTRAVLAKWGRPAQAQAGAVPLSAARRLFDSGWKAAALFCDRDAVVADGLIGFGACPQFEAAFSAAHDLKGGQHGTE